ncbi:hypothetical protein LCGC14_1831840, partial [marine sediment metagenome]
VYFEIRYINKYGILTFSRTGNVDIYSSIKGASIFVDV